MSWEDKVLAIVDGDNPEDVPEWMIGFIQWLDKRGLQVNTIASYLNDVRLYAQYIEVEFDEEFELSFLTGRDLRAYQRHVKKHIKAAGGTWNRYRSSLILLANYAVDCGAVQSVDMAGIDAVDQTELAPRWMTKGEYRKYMRIVDRVPSGSASDFEKLLYARNRALNYIMVHGGLRVHEASTLDVSNLTLTERKGWLKFIGKMNIERRVPLSAEARAAIREYLDLAFDKDYQGPMFVNKFGGRLSDRGVQRMVEDTAAQAKLDDREITPHVLRHTCAKRLIDAGTPLNIVQKIMGHQSIESTLRYVIPSEEDLEDAVEDL